MEKKKGLIQKLVVGSRNNETGYIMRALQVQCDTSHLPTSSQVEHSMTHSLSMEPKGALAVAGEAQDRSGRTDSTRGSGSGSAAAQAG